MFTHRSNLVDIDFYLETLLEIVALLVLRKHRHTSHALLPNR